MFFTQAICRLNIMFRHMPLPRDSSVLTSDYYCESVGNCQTLSKDGPSQLVNSIIFRPFFLFFASDVHHFLPILSLFDVRPPCDLHVFSCLPIDSSLYHVIFSHVTVFSVFFVKGKVEFVTLSANIDYLYLN